MNRAGKQEVLDCLQSFQEAHEEIKGALHHREKNKVQTMLSECQEFAISLGECIQRTEGESHITVSCIEEYCELLYHIFEEVSKGVSSEKEIYRSLRKQLIKIDNSVRNDIRVKKEIVFLPYKAAMWDSLESIWTAAENDPECVVYVIPIPYFDKKPDGSLGKMHYEGYEYPDYVPITDWKKYKLDEHRPDVVYIHNPYDQFNYVTSVHPDFYISKLKQYTNMLVYCPYFVGINDHVENHFCITPGVLYADRVIVESEAVKKIYIETLAAFEKENHCRGKFGNWGKKLLALGSPKLDKLKQIGKNPESLPEDWQRKIYREDGEKKTVVFYNTSLAVLLKNSDLYLKKIQAVIKEFSAQDSLVLLWRPHPLLEATLKSMRKELYVEYKEIQNKFISDDKGILDLDADLYKAIAISDLYYGDGSSVVTLFDNIGRPVVYQDIDSIKLLGAKKPFMIGLCAQGNQIYGMDYGSNQLLRFDLTDKKIHFQASLPGTSWNALQSYHYLFYEDGKFYFIPFWENQLVIWDEREELWEQIPLKSVEKGSFARSGNFYGCVKYGNILYMLPFRHRKVIAYNVAAKKQWVSFDFSDTVIGKDVSLFHLYEFMDKEHIVMPCLRSNHLVIMDLETGNCNIIGVGNSTYMFTAIKKYREKYVIVVKNVLTFLLWHPDAGLMETLDQFPSGAMLYNNKHCFDGEGIYIFKNYMYCFPAACNMAVRLDLDTLEITEISALRKYTQDHRLNTENSTFDGGTRIENKVYLHYQLQKILCFDLERETIEEYERECADSEEEKEHADKSFIDDIINKNFEITKENIERSELIGEKIHGYISKSLL